jgi:tRNA dimethylallyltransferase
MTDRLLSTCDALIAAVGTDLPVLIAGPTASGKSALALAIAEGAGGVIVNADASQVYDCWRVISARPSPQEEIRAPHLLYGHVAEDAPYSAGHWLRDVAQVLESGARPIFVGGTGLYFNALTQGLADVPAIPAAVRARAETMELPELLAGLDASTAARIDVQNRRRVQRGWEVLEATGRGLAAWQDDTGPPLLPLCACHAFAVDAPKDWLTPRIERRFDAMLAQGALDEVAAVRPRYDSALPAHRAIGVPELIAHLDGRLSLEDARTAAIIATRRYAKRQRTWLRSNTGGWFRYACGE